MKSSPEAYASIVMENKPPNRNQSSDKNLDPSTGFDFYKRGKLNSFNISSFHHSTWNQNGKNHWRKNVSVKWSWSQYSEVAPSDIAIKGMLMKGCYFTSMKCIMFSNQIVFMLLCFVLLLWPVCCTGKKHPPPPPSPLALRQLILCFSEIFSVFLFFF